MLTSKVSRRIPKPAVPWIAGLLAFLVASIVTWISPPVANIHDEFAYLLAADTFVEGRLANPAHPHWEHFESFHVLQQPANASKYPPAQGLFLAIGQLLGHPAIGVCLSTGFAVFAVSWMMSVCLPCRWLILTSLAMALHPGLQFVWGQTYWGGAIAFAGAAFVFGATIRLIRNAKLSHGFILAFGISVLAFSRPLEGMAAIAVAFSMLFFHFAVFNKVKHRSVDLPTTRRQFVFRVTLPLLIMGSLAISLMAWNNFSITGDAKCLPYKTYESSYASVPLFIWQNEIAMPTYRHREMTRFYEWDAEQCKAIKESAASIFFNKVEKLDESRVFFIGWLAIFLLLIPWICQRKEYLFLAAGLPLILLAASITPWGFPHYYAPAGPVIILLVIAGIRYARSLVRNIPFAKGILVPTVLLICLFSFVHLATDHFRQADQGWQWRRAEIVNKLESKPGHDLVLVRYSENHNCHNEWVYNSADIDRSEIVWARELSLNSDHALISYFSDRNIWLLHADEKEPRLTPYALESERSSDEWLSFDKN